MTTRFLFFIAAIFLTVPLIPKLAFSHPKANHLNAARADDESEAALQILSSVHEFLKKKLDRKDAPPEYRSAYQRLDEKLTAARGAIKIHPDHAISEIQKYLRSAGLSHLSFHKAGRGSFGFESIPLGNGIEKISKIYDQSPAYFAQLKEGDLVLSIRGVKASDALKEGISEDSQYDKSDIWIERIESSGSTRQISVQLKALPERQIAGGFLGLACGAVLPDGSAVVSGVSIGSPADKAGIKKGDLLISINDKSFVETSPGRPGDPAKLEIKKANGIYETFQTNYVKRSDFHRTYQQSIAYKGEKAVLLRVPDFTQAYDPQVVHQAFQKARDSAVLIDLRQNPGGRSDHLLAYLLKPNTKVTDIVGLAHLEEEIWNHKKEQVFQAWGEHIGSILDVQPTNRAYKELCRDEISHRLMSSLSSFDTHMPLLRISLPLVGLNPLQEWIVQSRTRIRKSLEMALNRQCEQLPSVKEIYCNQPGHRSGTETDEDQNIFPIAEDVSHISRYLNQTEAYAESSSWPNDTQSKPQNLAESYVKALGVLVEQDREKVQKLTTHIPLDFKKVEARWADVVKESPTPFKGKVVFIIDENTSCAAEICALVPLEYQQSSQNQGESIRSPLFAHDVRIIGKSSGGAQGLGEEVIRAGQEKYFLRYPLYDIYTFVNQHRLEGNGVQGEIEIDEDVMQAIESISR